MRILKKLQTVLEPRHPAGDVRTEIDELGRVIRDLPDLDDLLFAVAKDVSGETTSFQSQGGMTAEQILKAGILRTRFNWKYRELEHQTKDSLSVRSFLGLQMEESFSRSTLQRNIGAVTAATWERVNESVKRLAVKEGVEDGTIVRGDTTAVETNIHHPTDASLLEDVVRVMTRTLDRLAAEGVDISYSDHTRRAATRLYEIHNTRSDDKAQPLYEDLVMIAGKSLDYGKKALETMEKSGIPDSARKHAEVLTRLVPHAHKVVDQAFRRKVLCESVPADEKILSIFEPHTDIIVKGSREPTFGHKIAICAGSLLILSISVLEGNPTDASTLPGMLNAHKESYGSAPTAAAFDGAFASPSNLKYAKQAGVSELTFSKNGAIALENLVSAKAVHGMLTRFRAGVEGMISFLKRGFGCGRVLEKGLDRFKARITSAAVSFNLLALARSRIRQ